MLLLKETHGPNRDHPLTGFSPPHRRMEPLSEEPSGAWNNHGCFCLPGSVLPIIGWCCYDCWYMRNKSYNDTGDTPSDDGPVLVPVSGQLRAISCRTSDTQKMQFNSHTMDYSIYCLFLAALTASMDQGHRHAPGKHVCRWTRASLQHSSAEDSTSVIFLLTRYFLAW